MGGWLAHAWAWAPLGTGARSHRVPFCFVHGLHGCMRWFRRSCHASMHPPTAGCFGRLRTRSPCDRRVCADGHHGQPRVRGNAGRRAAAVHVCRRQRQRGGRGCGGRECLSAGRCGAGPVGAHARWRLADGPRSNTQAGYRFGRASHSMGWGRGDAVPIAHSWLPWESTGLSPTRPRDTRSAEGLDPRTAMWLPGPRRFMRATPRLPCQHRCPRMPMLDEPDIHPLPAACPCRAVQDGKGVWNVELKPAPAPPKESRPLMHSVLPGTPRDFFDAVFADQAPFLEDFLESQVRSKHTGGLCTRGCGGRGPLRQGTWSVAWACIYSQHSWNALYRCTYLYRYLVVVATACSASPTPPALGGVCKEGAARCAWAPCGLARLATLSASSGLIDQHWLARAPVCLSAQHRQHSRAHPPRHFRATGAST